MSKVFERVIFPIIIVGVLVLLLTFRCSEVFEVKPNPKAEHAEALVGLGTEIEQVYSESINELVSERDSLKKELARAKFELETMRVQSKGQQQVLQKRLSVLVAKTDPQERLIQCDSLVKELERHIEIAQNSERLCDEKQTLLDQISANGEREVSLLAAKANHWEATARIAIADMEGLKVQNVDLQKRVKRGKLFQRILASGFVLTSAVVLGSVMSQ